MSLLLSHDAIGKNFQTGYIGGRPQNQELPEFTFTANIQPISNRTTLALTGGRISSGRINVMSEIELVVSVENEDGTRSRGTYVQYAGAWYEVVDDQNWTTIIPELADLSYYKYAAEYREEVV